MITENPPNGKVRNELGPFLRARDIEWRDAVLNSPQFYPETANDRSAMWLSAKNYPNTEKSSEKKRGNLRNGLKHPLEQKEKQYRSLIESARSALKDTRAL
jgi:hypothetical protein